MLKYSYLKKAKGYKTISSIMDIINCHLPAQRQEYVFVQNSTSKEYRSYNEKVLEFLQNRPASTIKLGLVNMEGAEEIDVNPVNLKQGIFQVKGAGSILLYNVQFGNDTTPPSCTFHNRAGINFHQLA